MTDSVARADRRQPDWRASVLFRSEGLLDGTRTGVRWRHLAPQSTGNTARVPMLSGIGIGAGERFRESGIREPGANLNAARARAVLVVAGDVPAIGQCHNGADRAVLVTATPLLDDRRRGRDVVFRVGLASRARQTLQQAHVLVPRSLCISPGCRNILAHHTATVCVGLYQRVERLRPDCRDSSNTKCHRLGSGPVTGFTSARYLIAPRPSSASPKRTT